MKKRKFLLLILTAAIFMGCLPTSMALAEDAEPNITVTAQPLVEYGGTATASFIVTNNDKDNAVTITHVIPQPSDSRITGIKTPMTAMTVAPETSEAASCVLNISGDVPAGTHTVTLLVYAEGYAKAASVSFTLYKTTASAKEEPSATPAPSQGENLKALALDSTDLTGAVISAPSGDAGEKIKIRLPIKNRSASSFSGTTGIVSGAEITPVLSSSLDSFPFVIEELDYKRQLPVMAPGAKAEVVYEMKLSPNATSGVKEVKFNAVYYVDGVAETTTFSVFVTVVKGAAAAAGPDGTAATSVPKVIIKSYQTEPETLMAGETFKLTMELMNTSDKESVKNLKITVSNSDGVILPAGGASNTLYVKSIGKESAAKVEIELQSTPDIAAKSHSLAVQFDYEGGTTLTAYKDTADLSVPVSQPIRIKLDEPVIYGDGNMPEQPVSIGFSMFNMGKSAVYNCMVDVEGEGLKMEESYFGGNLASGSTMRADFNIIPSVAGVIDGNIIVTYEDVYGTEYEEKLPVTINVMEPYVPDDTMDDPDMNGDVGVYEPVDASAGLPWWGYVLIAAAAVAAAVVVLLQVRKARRRRAIEEE